MGAVIFVTFAVLLASVGALLCWEKSWLQALQGYLPVLGWDRDENHWVPRKIAPGVTECCCDDVQVL